MTNRVLAIILLSLASNIALSQTTISGIVLSFEDKSTIPQANISIYRIPEGSMLAYTFSGKSGFFSLNISDEELKKGIQLEISFIGFQKYTTTLYSQPSEPLTILLKEKPFKINEVVVKAPKISTKGDTLDYVTSAFTKEHDHNIGEVMQRIPGIVVDNSGLIKYNDQPINALYIDGKNMLESQYGIATNNIKPDLVTMIQIFENHQPIKALKEHRISENAAINLKITPSTKNKLIGFAELGAGISPGLWNARLTLFKFTGENQCYTIFKSNNDGTDISTELTMHSIGRDLQFQQPQLYNNTTLNIAGEVTPPAINERALFNSSHLTSINFLFPIGKSTQAILKIGYLYDNKDYNNSAKTGFIIGGKEEMLLVEKNSVSRENNMPSFDFTITANNDKLYIKNKLFGRASFAQTSGVVSGTANYMQNLSQDNYDFAEILNIIKPVGHVLLRFNSRTQVSSVPETLEIVSDSIRQSSELLQFSTENEFSTQIKIGKLRPEISFGFKQLTNHFSSCLSDSRSNTSLSGENDIICSNTEIYINPTLTCERNNFKLQFGAPFKASFIGLKDDCMKSDTTGDHIRISPQIRAVINLNPNIEGFLSYSYGSKYQTNPSGLTSSHILVNSLTLSKGYNAIVENFNHSASIGLTYKDILKLFHAWFNISFSTKSGGTRSSLVYNEFITERELIPDKKLSNQVIYASSNVSKAFFDNPLILKFLISYTSAISNVRQLDDNVKIKSESITVQPFFSYSFFQKVDMEFSNILSITNYSEIRGYNSECINNRSTLMTFFKFSNKLGMTIYIDNYMEKIDQQKASNSLFSDLLLNYQSEKVGIELALKNIFNKKRYISNTYFELTQIERIYQIRPRSIMVTFSKSF